jgi:hypothetical protein
VNGHAKRFVRLAKAYAWGLLIVANLSLLTVGILLWAMPDSSLVKTIRAFSSEKRPVLQLR